MRKGPVLWLDGGLSTTLEKRLGELHPTLWSAGHIASHGSELAACQREFLSAGCQILTLPTYQLSWEGVQRAGWSAQTYRDLLAKAMELTQAACENATHLPLLAASLGPYGAFLADGSEYNGAYQVDHFVRQYHHRKLKDFAELPVQILLFETIPHWGELELIVQLVEEVRPRQQVWLSLSLGDPETLADGTPLRQVFEGLRGSTVITALGANCFAPEWLPRVADQFADAAPQPYFFYPNAGEIWDAQKRRWVGKITAKDPIGDLWRKSDDYDNLIALGGCCRMDPKAMGDIISGHSDPELCKGG